MMTKSGIFSEVRGTKDLVPDQSDVKPTMTELTLHAVIINDHH